MFDLTVQGPGGSERVLRASPLPRREASLDRLQRALTQPSPAPEAPAPEPPPPVRVPDEPIQDFNPATLMGGGWAVTFPAPVEVATSTQGTFHFKTQLVAAVAAAAAMGPSADLPHRSPEGDAALAAYHQAAPGHQSLREGVDARFQPMAARVDLLD